MRKSLPKKTFATRIENKHGGGVPDCHLLWDGMPFWMEMKVSKGNPVNISPQQSAWNMAYFAKGGLSYYLVKRSSGPFIYLFEGSCGPALRDNGLRCDPLLRVEGPAALFCGLRPLVGGHYRKTYNKNQIRDSDLVQGELVFDDCD